MHELFLTASVKQADFDTACAVLQGLSWMTARRSIYRVLFFAGQAQPRGLASPPAVLPRAQEKQLWTELGKQLQRSSYVLQAAYEVTPETDFGRAPAAGADAAAAAASPSMDFTRLPATLRWLDFPDPFRDSLTAPRKKIDPLRDPSATSQKGTEPPINSRKKKIDSPITSRKKIEIPFMHGLPKALMDNKQTYTNELIQETYSFNRGDLEIVLSRYYHLPESPGRPIPHLPPWDDLRPVDSAQKWVLNVKLYVADDGQPEKLVKAHEELMRYKTEFDKLFDFKIVDRKAFDTRISPPPIIPGRGPQ
ncbi:mediator complex, subunit Med18 [Nemania abortiva]|nr:mediator complex, subunit Med18 [Nemania abortiva]